MNPDLPSIPLAGPTRPVPVSRVGDNPPRPPELRPKAGEWNGRRGLPPNLYDAHGENLLAGSAWLNPQGVIVLSLLLLVEDPVLPEKRAEWHLSMTHGGEKVPRGVARQVLREFGVMDAAAEVKCEGIGRHYVVRCDSSEISTPGSPAVEHVAFVDEHGQRWSNFAGAQYCDGCKHAEHFACVPEIAEMARCALHRRST